jgi:hypothetical protein
MILLNAILLKSISAGAKPASLLISRKSASASRGHAAALAPDQSGP